MPAKRAIFAILNNFQNSQTLWKKKQSMKPVRESTSCWMQRSAQKKSHANFYWKVMAVR